MASELCLPSVHSERSQLPIDQEWRKAFLQPMDTKELEPFPPTAHENLSPANKHMNEPRSGFSPGELSVAIKHRPTLVAPARDLEPQDLAKPRPDS